MHILIKLGQHRFAQKEVQIQRGHYSKSYIGPRKLYWATKIVLGQVNLAQQNGPREEAAGTVQLETLEKHEMQLL